jgi:hypothetical protein
LVPIVMVVRGCARIVPQINKANKISLLKLLMSPSRISRVPAFSPGK